VEREEDGAEDSSSEDPEGRNTHAEENKDRAISKREWQHWKTAWEYRSRAYATSTAK